MNLETLTSLFAWMTVINICLLLFTTAALMGMKSFVIRSHQLFFKLSEEQLETFYFNYLAKFKIAVLVFNLTPYLALRILA